MTCMHIEDRNNGSEHKVLCIFTLSLEIYLHITQSANDIVRIWAMYIWISCNPACRKFFAASICVCLRAVHLSIYLYRIPHTSYPIPKIPMSLPPYRPSYLCTYLSTYTSKHHYIYLFYIYQLYNLI